MGSNCSSPDAASGSHHRRQSRHHNGEIARQVVDYDRVLACCVDLDYSAQNTLGKCGAGAALDARTPLSLPHHRDVGLSHAARACRIRAPASGRRPDPLPVVSDRLRIEPWWSNSATTKLVLSEYLKYLAAKVRMRFDSWTNDAAASELPARGVH